MSYYSENEWSPLKKIIVGTATNAHWPVHCEGFRSLEKTTTWKETPVPAGPVDANIVFEANQDLETLCALLRDFDVDVVRPKDLDFQSFDGMYNYCPRDRVLIIGDKAIDCPMVFPTRIPEINALKEHLPDLITCDDPDAKFDAANVCRLGKDLLYLVSDSGNVAGGKWLQKLLGNDYRVHMIDLYSGVHIDSTIIPLQEGLVMLNGDRLNNDTCPKVFKNWDKIWVTARDLREKPFHKYPYASNYIAMNVLSIDPLNVVCDYSQKRLREKLEDVGITTHGVDIYHSRTLGGGHHCVTLDLKRC